MEGEFVYGALGDKPDDKDLASPDVLMNPYFERVTLERNFLRIPLLENLITDSHFAKRDRMGRSLGFLARIVKDGWSRSPREVAIDEKSAVLVESDGKAKRLTERERRSRHVEISVAVTDAKLLRRWNRRAN